MFEFFEFLCYFFWNFLPRIGYERNSRLKFFFTFSANLIPVWIEIMPEWCFLFSWTFLLFFLEFSSPGWVGTELGSKIFFFLFLNLSNPGLDRNNVGMMVFNFLNFFFYFFCNFLARVGLELNPGLKFFSPFLGLSHPGFDRNNARMVFFNFLNFLNFSRFL